MHTPYSINVRGRLLSLQTPQVMGILNATPDSFYAGSRSQTEAEIVARVKQIRAEGAAIVDVGAYSTRPGASDVPVQEELSRLGNALNLVRREWPDAVVSVDTFRADGAAVCVEEYGADIINDIGGGLLDDRMFDTVARLRVPYVLMHMQGTLQTMHQVPHYGDCALEVFRTLAERLSMLQEMGVPDVIIDPGFGFSKSLDDNYQLFSHLEEFRRLCRPILVGVSRKTMVWKLLDLSPDESLNGTTALNTLALAKGADLLRVHDVKEAVEVVRIFQKMQTNNCL